MLDRVKLSPSQVQSFQTHLGLSHFKLTSGRVDSSPPQAQSSCVHLKLSQVESSWVHIKLNWVKPIWIWVELDNVWLSQDHFNQVKWGSCWIMFTSCQYQFRL